MPTGPITHQILNRPERGERPFEGYEYPLYTDALIDGGLSSIGPIEVLNTLRRLPHLQTPALVVRIEARRNEIGEEIDFSRTNSEHWHGGDLADEIAAILSLALGVRLQSGRHNRIFTNAEPKGHPCVFDQPLPKTPVIPDFRRMLVPILSEKKSLQVAEPLWRTLSGLSPGNFTVLTKAARLYQHATWIAESEPSLSWLLIVSAAETVGITRPRESVVIY